MANKALIVGINYSGDKKLTTCVNDARSLKDKLLWNADLTKNFDCALLTDAQACYIEFKDQLESLFLGGFDDTVLFYFAGHSIKTKEDVYLMTYDYSAKNNGISMNDIIVLAAKSKAKNKIIILDSCYSASFGIHELANNLSFVPENTVFISSCGSNQKAYSYGTKNGVFTSLLLDGLESGAEDLFGNITVENLYEFVDKALSPWDQRPYFKANISEPVIIKKTNPIISIADFRRLTKFFTKQTSKMTLKPIYADFERYLDGKVDYYEDFKLLNKFFENRIIKPVKQYSNLYEVALNGEKIELTKLGKFYHECLVNNKI